MRFSTREDIAAPVDRVFAAITDFDAMERAILRRGIEVVRLDSLTAPGAGMAWKASFDFRGKRRDLVSELAGFTPPEGISITSTISELDCLTRIDLVPLAPHQTRLMVALDLKPQSLSSRVFLQTLRLARARMAQRFGSAVTRFARDVEAGKYGRRG